MTTLIAFLALSSSTTANPAWVKTSNGFTKKYNGKTLINAPKMTEKVIALTFDDGPSPFTTPPILDSLKKADAKATFFVVGQMCRGREKILLRIANEGHAVANHSWSHPMNPSAASARGEIEQTNAIIKKTLGFTPRLYRPPYGNLKARSTGVAKTQGMPIVIWTGSGGDTSTKSPDRVYQASVAAIKPGAIILLHDLWPHTMKAVPRILATAKKMGYTFITVPEMLDRWEKAEANAPATPSVKATAKPVAKPTKRQVKGSGKGGTATATADK